MAYKAPIRDMQFIYDEVLNIDQYADLGTFAEATKETRDVILEEMGKFCEQVLAPLNHVGDTEGCIRHEDGSVTTPKGFKEAYQQYCEAAWPTIGAEPEFGGQGLPHVLTLSLQEMASSANMAWAMYPIKLYSGFF